jgi:hypothetical protein
MSGFSKLETIDIKHYNLNKWETHLNNNLRSVFNYFFNNATQKSHSYNIDYIDISNCECMVRDICNWSRLNGIYRNLIVVNWCQITLQNNFKIMLTGNTELFINGTPRVIKYASLGDTVNIIQDNKRTEEISYSQIKELTKLDLNEEMHFLIQ